MDSTEIWLISFIGTMTLATMITRFLPFIFFNKLKKNKVFRYIGDLLPLMIMPILVVYALKGSNFQSLNTIFPEAVAVATVTGIHLWRSNAFLSICIGTTVFIFLK